MRLKQTLQAVYRLFRPIVIGVAVFVPLLLLTPKLDTPAWVSVLVLVLPLGVAATLVFAFGRELSFLRSKARSAVEQQKGLEQTMPKEGARGVSGVVRLDDGDTFAARLEIEFTPLPVRQGRAPIARCAEKTRQRFTRPFTLVLPDGVDVRVNPGGIAPSKIEAPLGPLLQASGRFFRIAEIVDGDAITVIGRLSQERQQGVSYRDGTSDGWVLRPSKSEAKAGVGWGYEFRFQSVLRARNERKRLGATLLACTASFVPGQLTAIAVLGFAFADMLQGLPHRLFLAAIVATLLTFAGAVPVRQALDAHPWFHAHRLPKQVLGATDELAARILTLSQTASNTRPNPAQVRAQGQSPRQQEEMESEPEPVVLERS